MVDLNQDAADVIVIGGGVNGLVTAAYLARAGKTTRLFERRPFLGGLAVTETLFPDHQFSTLVDGAGLLAPSLVSELNLPKHGLESVPTGLISLSLQPDGHHLALSRDVAATATEIAHFSQRDAGRYPAFVKTIRGLSAVLRGLMHITPPDLPEFGFGDLIKLAPLGKPLWRIGRDGLAQLLRIMPISVADLLDEWFESEIVKGAIAAPALLDASFGPQEPGTAHNLLHRWALSNNALFRSDGNFVGGMSALARAIARAATAYGAELRVNSAVERIILKDRRAAGIELDSGARYHAKAVVSAANMKTTFVEWLEPSQVEAGFISKVQKIRCRGTTARVHFVLDSLPRFRGIRHNAQHLLSGHIQIAPTLTYLQKAFDPTKYGRCSEEYYLDLFIPSLTDRTLTGSDHHLMSVTVKYVPYHCRQDRGESERDDLAQIVIRQIESYAPGFGNLVRQHKVITPLALEQDYDLPEGSYTHGEMTLDQFMWMRPVPGYGQYRSPIDNLYLGGPATHPGGRAGGISGRNAAREMLKDGIL